MSDSALPQIPGAPAPAPFTSPAPAAAPAGAVPRAPGRPNDDPIKAEERASRHADRRRLEAALPKRAIESKVQLFRKDPRTGRKHPTARPVLTVLISDLEAARDNGQDADEYLQDLLLQRLGDRADGVYEAITVDKRGSRLDLPSFDVVVGSEPVDGDDQGDDGDDPGDEGDDGGPLSAAERTEFEAMQAGPAGRGTGFFQPQQAQPPPPAPPLDMAVVDEVGRRNRDEAKNDSTNTMALVMQVMQQGQTAAIAAQAQQTQLMLEALRANSRPPDSGNKEVMVGVVAALAPILAKLLEPKPADPIMQALLLKLVDRPDQSAGVTTMMAEVMKMSNGMMSEAAKNSMAVQMNNNQQATAMQAELTKGLIQNTLQMIKEQRQAPVAVEKDGDSGGGMMESVAKIAAAVLPAMMAGQQAAPAAEAPPALPAPAEAAPAPRPARPVPKTPPPAAPQAPAAPVPRANRNDPNNRIRTCLREIAKLQIGAVAAEQRWALAQWIMKNAPQPVIAEIRRSSFDGVVAACAEAVMADEKLIAWISVPASQEFLKEFLDDARKLEGGAVNDEYMAQQIVKTRNQQQKPTPGPDPAPKAAEVVAAPAPAATAAPVTPAPPAETPPAAPAAG